VESLFLEPDVAGEVSAVFGEERTLEPSEIARSGVNELYRGWITEAGVVVTANVE